jgi:hypothetical protein
MKEWALMHRGKIVNVVTTNESKDSVQQHHPTYEVVDLYSLPTNVLERYEFWRNRP